MIALLGVLACVGAAVDGSVPLPAAAEKATFATVSGLGSYRLQADVRRSIGGEGVEPFVTTESVELRWRDADRWSYLQRKDERVRSDVRVWDAVAWTNGGAGPLVNKGDAEPFRVQLAGTWDPWSWALEGLANGVRLEPQGMEIVEGRRAIRHTVSPLPPPEPPPQRAPRGWSVTAAEGEVWIDEATAVRLKGQVKLAATSGRQTQEVSLSFSIVGVGVDPEVSAPPGDKP
ncbi:MAG: hypothetical protein Q8P18_20360 [Pseudomonadota bacterium]|nr:hypothetical protein [Pseudomonadota bacterium]